MKWCTRRIYVYSIYTRTHTHTSTKRHSDTNEPQVERGMAKPRSSSSSNSNRTTNKQTNPPSNTHFSTIDELRKIMSWKPVILYQQVSTDDVYFTTRHWIINTKEPPKKRKLMKFIFCADNILYTHIDTVPWSRCGVLFVLLFFFFFFHQCRRHIAEVVVVVVVPSIRGLFVWLFHEEFFLSFIFHSLSLVISFFSLPWLTLFARHSHWNS